MNAEDRDLLWQRVHTALDRRLDPLDDEVVQQALLEDEATRDAYARLIEGLRAVPRAGRPMTPRLRLPLRRIAPLEVVVPVAMVGVACVGRSSCPFQTTLPVTLSNAIIA